MTKSETTKERAQAAFEKVRPEVRNLAAAALIEAGRAAIGRVVRGPRKPQSKET